MSSAQFSKMFASIIPDTISHIKVFNKYFVNKIEMIKMSSEYYIAFQFAKYNQIPDDSSYCVNQ